MVYYPDPNQPQGATPCQHPWPSGTPPVQGGSSWPQGVQPQPFSGNAPRRPCPLVHLLLRLNRFLLRRYSYQRGNRSTNR